jgi:hypothetical protein
MVASNEKSTCTCDSWHHIVLAKCIYIYHLVSIDRKTGLRQSMTTPTLSKPLVDQRQRLRLGSQRSRMFMDDSAIRDVHSNISSIDKPGIDSQDCPFPIHSMPKMHSTLNTLPNELLYQIINGYDSDINIPWSLSRRDSRTLLSLRL